MQTGDTGFIHTFSTYRTEAIIIDMITLKKLPVFLTHLFDELECYKRYCIFLITRVLPYSVVRLSPFCAITKKLFGMIPFFISYSFKTKGFQYFMNMRESLL